MLKSLTLRFATYSACLDKTQDGSGWTPLMIASSLRDGDELVDILLRKGADVSVKSKLGSPLCTRAKRATLIMADYNGQVSRPSYSIETVQDG